MSLLLHAQHRWIRGSVTNPFTREKISFASVSWKKAGTGSITDSAGHFRIAASSFPHDTLIVSYSGFIPLMVPNDILKNTDDLSLFLSEGRRQDSVIVKVQYNRGYLWWKKIVRNKTRNDPERADAYSCELYNKLELDLNNIHRDGFNKYKLLRPFGFILDNIDSVSENNPFLPVFMTETLSDYYHSSDPAGSREEIKAVQTNGIKNEMALHFLEEMHPKINSYDNYISLLGKEFISPLGSIAGNYYDYLGADTQRVSGKVYLHLFFSPKRDGGNVFSGDCWIDYPSWAIRKVNLTVSPFANLNYVKRMNIIQEFARQTDSTWVFAKDKLVAELSPLKKDKLSLIARKTSMYRNIRYDAAGVAEELKKNTKKEVIVLSDSATIRDPDWWNAERHEPLSANEQKVYKMIDTLKNIPLFRKYTDRVEFIVDGRKKLGEIEIGPWYKWISGNQRERVRLRFDLGTTGKFSRYLRLHGYVAYGFRDKAFKGKTEAIYRIPGVSALTVQGSWLHDLDNGRVRYNDEDPTTDNMFSQLIRRPGIRQKFLRVDEIKTSVTKEWLNNITIQLSLSRSDYETFNPLPPKWQIAIDQKDLVNTDLGLRVRYAPGENRLMTARKEFHFSGSNPVFEARYSVGLPGVAGGKYTYQKTSLMINQDFRIPGWGKIGYRAYAGKIFSHALPFMLLELHPGNEVWYYSKEAFNLMSRFEYFSDRYAGFRVEHNFEKKLLNLLPLLRRAKIRQFWNLKAVWGDLSPENRLLNRTELGSYHLRSLHGSPYMEAGTGLDNIFKYFRLDLVWSLIPGPKQDPRFGMFGSFHVQF